MCAAKEEPRYIGAPHFRIAISEDDRECLSRLHRLLSALRTKNTAAIRQMVLFLAHEVGLGADTSLLIAFLESLTEELQGKRSAAKEVQDLLDCVCADRAERASILGVSPLAASAFAEHVLEIIIPVVSPEFHTASVAVWARIESKIARAGSSDHSELPTFQKLADLVSRTDSPDSWRLLMGWVRHWCPWVRNQAAWSLRHWWSPDLWKVLCEVLLLGKEDAAAQEQSFFLLWRLERLAEPEALPTLRSLIGTGYDVARELPGNPPPGTPKVNALRQAIRACGGSAEE